ncbi:N-arachidonyl glycine receptor [Protopterus annectens]|uniref:N-arachidonyl glycine receptor n=1 Tax=Protopterus annectens TaxID=7888 RepID=UPI001CFB3C78|nr:N-arachidonyl glycine receptor [Protopterus annectens]XP_043927241.1 N-arachidonyl glycine receptor [Protopterus annectens]
MSLVEPDEYRIAALVFYSFVFSIGLIVNATALWVFSCTTKKRTSVTVYMMNVALIDLLFILLMPFRLIYYGKNSWPFGDIFCRINSAFSVFYPCTSLWLFAVISTDRYMAIVQPKHAKELKNISKAVMSCIAIWVISSGWTIPVLFLNSDPDKNSNFTTCLKMHDITHLKEINLLNYARLILFFLVPMTIMIVCYVVIIHSLIHGKNSKLKPKVKEKSIKIIVTLIIQILFCFVPFHVCFTFLLLYNTQQFYNPWAAFTTMLMNLSTCLDIILYYIVSKQFQDRVISVILYRNYLRSVRRKSLYSASQRSLSNINSAII